MTGLPPIDGWAITATPFDSLDDIAQSRLDAQEVGEVEAHVSTERTITAPGEQIDEYRARMTRGRRQLVRARLEELVGAVDATLDELAASPSPPDERSCLRDSTWERLKGAIAEIDRLLVRDQRSAVDRLRRHLGFAEARDLLDIRDRDWPAVKREIAQRSVRPYGADPGRRGRPWGSGGAAPSGRATTALQWTVMDADGFERLIFDLIADARGYENPQWLMRTNAPDRGRDLSVARVREDTLSGVRRERVMIQCKHWLTKSVADTDVSDAATKMSHWEPPPVDVLIIATSGRFTADAVKWVEQRNHAGTRPHVEMWPKATWSTCSRTPHLVANFKLR